MMLFSLFLTHFVFEGCLNEAHEQRMRIEHRAAVFGVILCANIPFAAWHLNHFNKMSFGVLAHAAHTRFFELIAELVVELKAVAVTLLNHIFAVSLSNCRATGKTASIGTQTHCTTKVRDAFLLLHEVDYVIRRLGVHLGAVGIGHAQHVAGKLNDHALHAQADSEGWHVVFAAPLQCHKLALNATLTKARSHNHAIESAEHIVHVIVAQFLAADIFQVELGIVINSRLE